MNKYFIKVFGCQMNIADGERLESFLIKKGLKKAEDEENADFIFFISCSVKQKAEDKLFGAVRKSRKKNAKKKIIITGCVSNHVKDKIKNVDFFFNINEFCKLGKFITKVNCMDLLSQKKIFDFLPKTKNDFSVFVPIMTGCDNFCSYCIVPYTRGREQSRNFEDVLTECKQHGKNGKIEITLLGQNVNSYKYDFPKLLDKVAKIKNIKRIRFMSSHPKDLSDDLIDVIAKNKNICRHIHLASQHGDDEILKKMNRKYTSKYFLSLLSRIRKKIKKIQISTDIIVGFPSETEKHFEKLCDFYKKADFSFAFISQFSPRKGTVAEKFCDDVSNEEKKKRWKILNEIQKKIKLDNHKKDIGKKISVLVEKFENGKNMGKDEFFRSIEFFDKNRVGEIVEIKIDSVMEWVLCGSKCSLTF